VLAEYKAHSKAVVTTSWDDGHPMDTKLAELLLELGIKGTFYVAPSNREHAVIGASELRDLSKHFEIGAHTLTHPDLRRLNDSKLYNEINGSKLELENVLGTPVSMFCYPNGRYNNRVRKAVVNAGFIGARTTREFYLTPGADEWQMYTTIMSFPLQPWIRIRHDLRTGNYHGLKVLWQRGIGRSWAELAYSLFEEILAHGGVWHLWGHSWEIEEYDLWDSLRAILNKVAHRECVSYLTNAQVVSNLDWFSIKQ